MLLLQADILVFVDDGKYLFDGCALPLACLFAFLYPGFGYAALCCSPWRLVSYFVPEVHVLVPIICSLQLVDFLRHALDLFLQVLLLFQKLLVFVC